MLENIGAIGPKRRAIIGCNGSKILARHGSNAFLPTDRGSLPSSARPEHADGSINILETQPQINLPTIGACIETRYEIARLERVHTELHEACGETPPPILSGHQDQADPAEGALECDGEAARHQSPTRCYDCESVAVLNH